MSSKPESVSPIRDDRQIVIHPTDNAVEITVGDDISIMDLWCAIGTLQHIAWNLAHNASQPPVAPSPIVPAVVMPQRKVD